MESENTMKEKPLISIIVPVYNIQKYVPRCINSIISQTYNNIEIIIVNDGSKDNSSRICRDYAKTDSRIVLIEKENGGLSSARNAGMAVMKGEFISFIDGDDFVAPNFIEVLCFFAQQYSAEIVQCQIIQGREDEFPLEVLIKDIAVERYSGKEYLRNLYNIRGMECVANKLFHKNIFRTILFPLNRINEDVAVTYKLIYKSEKIVYVKAPLYYYFLSPNSIMRGTFHINKLSGLLSFEERMNFLIEKEEVALHNRSLQQYEAVLLKFYYNMRKYYPKEQSIQKDLKKKLRTTYKAMLPTSEIKLIVKLLTFFAVLLPYSVGWVCNKVI